jgi:hypothetical protein
MLEGIRHGSSGTQTCSRATRGKDGAAAQEQTWEDTLRLSLFALRIMGVSKVRRTEGP